MSVGVEAVAMVVAMVVVLLRTMVGLVVRIQLNKFKFEIVMGVLDLF